jgi:hypothetical protein
VIVAVAIFGLAVNPASAAPVANLVYGYCERPSHVPGDPGPNFYWDVGLPCDLDPFVLGNEGIYWSLYSLQNNPDGWVDVLDRNVIAGWARDLDAPAASTSVTVRVDVSGDGRGFYDYATVPANVSRPDVGGSFGFNFVHSLPPGTRVKVKALGVDSAGGADGFDHHLRRASEGVPLSSGDHTFLVP